MMTEKEVNMREVARKSIYSSSLFKTLKPFIDNVAIFPESTFELKPKQMKQIKDLSWKLYSYHTVFESVFHNLKSTLVLQGSYRNLNFLVKESALFAWRLDNFYNDKNKDQIAKKNQHLQKYYKDNFSLKSKDVLSALLDDVQYISETYGLDYDKKELINFYKECLEFYSRKDGDSFYGEYEALPEVDLYTE
tara:strand:- start:7558 stop:8133 length:576 start_codon:yes stop_codon:yes gene_type:complete